MHKSILILAERQSKKLDDDLKNTWRIGHDIPIKVNSTIDNYREVVHMLLKENRELKEDLNALKSDKEEGYFLSK